MAADSSTRSSPGRSAPRGDSSPPSASVLSAGYDKPNADKAKQLLASAGYSPANPLKLTVITITGYTDWDASLAVVKQQLQPIVAQAINAWRSAGVDSRTLSNLEHVRVRVDNLPG